MNVNEECLINYLKKPDELACTTEVLMLYNKFIKEKIIDKIKDIKIIIKD